MSRLLCISLIVFAITAPLAQCGKAVLAGGEVDNYNSEIYDAFISQASPNGATPYIGVITAGTSLDIAESTANLIISELKNIYGLKNVVWLPYHPDNGTTCNSTAWNSELNSMTGLYFNGGNSEPMIDCFLPDGYVSPALSIMRSRYASSSLALYGSSAGTVILQANPVLQIQDSWNALVYGPIYASRGMSIFNHGFLDVHFSTRGRHGAFTRLIWDKKTYGTMGFGIDQNTAMVMQDENSFTVAGTAGVYMIDVSVATAGSAYAVNNGRWALENVRVFYLTDGDSYNFNTRTITLARGKAKNAGNDVYAKYSADIFSDDMFTLLTTGFFNASLSTSTYGYTTETDPRYRINFRKTSISSSYVGTVNGVSKMSYVYLYMDIYCSENC